MGVGSLRVLLRVTRCLGSYVVITYTYQEKGTHRQDVRRRRRRKKNTYDVGGKREVRLDVLEKTYLCYHISYFPLITQTTCLYCYFVDDFIYFFLPRFAGSSILSKMSVKMYNTWLEPRRTARDVQIAAEMPRNDQLIIPYFDRSQCQPSYVAL